MVSGSGGDKGGSGGDKAVGEGHGHGQHVSTGADGKPHPVPSSYHHKHTGYGNKASWQTETTGSPFWHPSPKDMPEPPVHFQHNAVNLEMHLGDPRQRLAGMTDAERAWRKKFVLDQHLADNEPMYVPEFHANLNPIRRIYRLPWDAIESRFLVPKFGLTYGHLTRMVVPKILMGLFGFSWLYYHLKYHQPNWMNPKRLEMGMFERQFLREDEIREKEPGLMEKGLRNYQTKQDYCNRDFKNRYSHLNLERPLRP